LDDREVAEVERYLTGRIFGWLELVKKKPVGSL
jgi:hypothetical protein